MEISEEKFFQIKEKAETYYGTIGSVYCPYLKESVAFNVKGLEHLKFKGRDKARVQQDQYTRFRLLELAPKILSMSYTLQGYSETHESLSVKTNGRRKSVIKKVVFYEFIAVIKNHRVRIIVREPEGERKYFWSIIPFWKMDPVSGKRLMHNGNPTGD